MNKDRYIKGGSALAFAVNLILFAVKLYVGLSTNSISIYSDGINNLFDSLSGALALVCLMLLGTDKSPGTKSVIRGCENLLSFIMSVIVALAGFSFAYSSVERLMYPTPIWYREKYLLLLIASALVKVILHFIFRAMCKKAPSPVMKVIAVDSLLDFFVTSVTILSLLLSSKGSYSIDSLAGIAISVLIITSAVKLVFSSAADLTGFVPQKKRAALEATLTASEEKAVIQSITYLRGEEGIEAFAELSACTSISQETLTKIKNETGITVHISYRKESTEALCENAK